MRQVNCARRGCQYGLLEKKTDPVKEIKKLIHGKNTVFSCSSFIAYKKIVSS